jgi:hypothetical protein
VLPAAVFIHILNWIEPHEGVPIVENSKECQLTLSEKDGIHEIVIAGPVMAESFENLRSDIYNLIRTHNIRALLLDVRNIEEHLPLADVYFSFRKAPSRRPDVRTAIVDTPENMSFQSFQETVAVNAGYPIKCFSDIDAARAWLKDWGK